MIRRRVLASLCGVLAAVPGALAGPAAAGEAGGAIQVTSAGYRLTAAAQTCDLSLELRQPDGSWVPVGASPADIVFGVLTAEEAGTTAAIPAAWVRGTLQDAVSLAARVLLDPLGGTALEVHLLCADEGILIGGRLEGPLPAEGGSLWCPPRVTLSPAAWERYAFLGPGGELRTGRIADLAPVPAYAGVSPWGQSGDAVPALDAAAPILVVLPRGTGPGLGVVLVGGSEVWAGSSSFLQRHNPASLYFYTGYTPLQRSPGVLRWAWLAPLRSPDQAPLAAQAGALLAKAEGLLAAYHPGPLPMPPGAEPVPDFPAPLRRTEPVRDIRDAVIYTINEGTRSAYGLELARKVGSEVMIRAWFKWGKAPPVHRWRELPRQAHAFGALFGGGITCSALYDNENGLTPEQVLDMATRGPDGNLVDAWDRPGIRHGSLSSPAYLDYLLRWCREQIEAGADYLFMDEHTAALSDREGYDDHSLNAFRRFLLEEYEPTRGWAETDPRWLAEFGIDPSDRALCPGGTVASFDYRAYLRARGHLERPRRPENPLAAAWDEFRAQRDGRAWKLLTDRIRACAAEQGRKVLISANGIAPFVDLQVLGVWGQWATREGHIDLSEDLIPHWRAVVRKGCRAAGREVPVVLFHDWGFGDPPFPWLAVPPSERVVWMRTRGAEIFAAGAFFAFPVLGPFGCDALRDGTLAAMARQTAFYARHRGLYLRSRWLGREGLGADADGLSLAAAWSDDARAVVLHVVNRDVRAGALVPRTGPVRVRLPLPSPPDAAVAISPDHEGERPLECREAEGAVEVVLPSLEAYSVVLLRYAAAPDLSAITDASRIWPARRWARPRRAEFRVLPGGAIEHDEDLEGFLQGMLHTHLRNPPVFLVEALGPAELRVRVRAVAAAGARLSVRIDEETPVTVDLPDLDGKNTDALEYGRTVPFPIPPGRHRVSLDNTGGDWLVLEWLEFAGAFAEPPPVRGQTPWRVEGLQHAEDRVAAAEGPRGPVVEVTSRTGIGWALLSHDGPGWPREICVRLRYADGSPFARLEGFSAAVIEAGAEAGVFRLEGTRTAGPEGIEVRFGLPADLGPGARLRLSWVDAYR